MLKTSSYQDVKCGHGIINSLGTKMSIYLYLVDGLLIDTGPSNLKHQSSVFFNDNLINQVALTHLHEDHSGMAFWLQKNKEVPVYLSSISVPSASKKAGIPLYRKIIWGKRLAFEAHSYKDTISTNKYMFKVIPTPGHSEDHIVLYEQNMGWLFTGDLYLGTKQIVCMAEENIPKTIESLKLLSKLDVTTLFCGHSGIHDKNVKQKINKRLDYFLELEEKVNFLYNQGLSIKQIDKKLFPQKLPITYISKGEWSSLNIIKSIIYDKK